MTVKMDIEIQATVEQYKKANEILDLENNPAEGLLMHAASHDGTVLRVTDIWVSVEELNDFFGSRLAPIFDELGIPPAQPVIAPLVGNFDGDGYEYF